MGLSRIFDLKLRLALRVAALASLCFIAAAAYALFDSDRSARAKADGIATLVAKDLQLQQSQRTWMKVADDRFPDLQAIADPLMAPGLCIAYRGPKGEIMQRVCSGAQPGEADAPAVFAALYDKIFGQGAEAAHPVVLLDDAKGAAVVTLDQVSLVGQSWREASRLLGVMAVTLLALCILVYAALARALRPTRTIQVGLERLAQDDLTARLPAFDLAELSGIGAVFNTLAERLQTTLAERNALTQKLIAVQDEERRHLARELHDEFGQCLAAISAVAASASQTAREDCPALLPECQSIARTAAHMMETLRGTLVRLRPPDVDELGLASSLESLVAGWNSRSRGRTRFDIEVCGSFDALPAAFGENLYRIAQEAITNSAKHAEATHVELRLEMREDEHAAQMIELTVEDDGKASGREFASKDLMGKARMGLLGMRERIAALGGSLSFEPRRPSGLIVRAAIAAPHALSES